MQDNYKKILLKFEKRTQILEKKVGLMEKINSEGIKFSEMKVEALVKRLY